MTRRQALLVVATEHSVDVLCWFPVVEFAGHLVEIVSVEQLALLADVGDFWVSRSLEDLADAQGVGVIDRIDDLRDETISEEEANAFLAALGL